MKVLYLDESGNHNIEKIDPDYPVFVLGGVIVEERYAETHIESQVNEFKNQWFGSTDTILHTADIVRNRNGFEMLSDPTTRNQFFDEMNDMMRRLEYSVVACVVNKRRYAKQARRSRGATRWAPIQSDLYRIALDDLLEVFYYEVEAANDRGMVVAERREVELDYRISRAWNMYRFRGTTHLSGRTIWRRIRDLDLRLKKHNITGLQLADLVVSPIARYALGKPDKPDWEIVKSKLLDSKAANAELGGIIRIP